MFGSFPIASTPLGVTGPSTLAAPPSVPSPQSSLLVLIDTSRYHLIVREYYRNIIDNGGNIWPSSLGPLSYFVHRLIRSTLWDKFDEIYPFCGHGIAAACVKLKYRDTPFLTNHNFTDEDFEEWGPTAGLIPDGFSKYLDTNFPATALRDDAHLCYIEKAETGAGIGAQATAIGVSDGIHTWCIGGQIDTDDRTAILGDPAIMAGTPGAYANWTSFYLANRETPTILRLYKRTHLKATNPTATTTNPKPALNFFLAACNISGTPHEHFGNPIRFASIGRAFTQDESAQYYQIVQSLQEALGRSV